MGMKDKVSALNSLLANPPAEIGFTDEYIEQILRAEYLFCHLQTIDEGGYLDNFLSSLDWWINVANVLLCEPDSGRPNRSSGEEYHNITDKISEILLLYPVAFKARYLAKACGSDPTGLELVKRYAKFTEYIRTLAQRDFPQANWDQIQKAA